MEFEGVDSSAGRPSGAFFGSVVLKSHCCRLAASIWSYFCRREIFAALTTHGRGSGLFVIVLQRFQEIQELVRTDCCCLALRRYLESGVLLILAPLLSVLLFIILL